MDLPKKITHTTLFPVFLRRGNIFFHPTCAGLPRDGLLCEAQAFARLPANWIKKRRCVSGPGEARQGKQGSNKGAFKIDTESLPKNYYRCSMITDSMVISFSSCCSSSRKIHMVFSFSNNGFNARVTKNINTRKERAACRCSRTEIQKSKEFSIV